jgi:hypothetical protein
MTHICIFQGPIKFDAEACQRSLADSSGALCGPDTFLVRQIKMWMVFAICRDCLRMRECIGSLRFIEHNLVGPRLFATGNRRRYAVADLVFLKYRCLCVTFRLVERRQLDYRAGKPRRGLNDTS